MEGGGGGGGRGVATRMNGGGRRGAPGRGGGGPVGMGAGASLVPMGRVQPPASSQLWPSLHTTAHRRVDGDEVMKRDVSSKTRRCWAGHISQGEGGWRKVRPWRGRSGATTVAVGAKAFQEGGVGGREANDSQQSRLRHPGLWCSGSPSWKKNIRLGPPTHGCDRTGENNSQTRRWVTAKGKESWV